MTEERKSRPWHWVVVGLIVVGVAGVVLLRGRPIDNGDEQLPIDVAHALE